MTVTMRHMANERVSSAIGSAIGITAVILYMSQHDGDPWWLKVLILLPVTFGLVWGQRYLRDGPPSAPRQSRKITPRIRKLLDTLPSQDDKNRLLERAASLHKNNAGFTFEQSVEEAYYSPVAF